MLAQPLGFGTSYIVIDQAMKDHPEDELPLAALQCMLCAVATLAIASATGGVAPWDLDLAALLGRLAAPDGSWAVPGAVLYTGLWGTAATIWLQAAIFKRLPAVDASVILSTEPLWAAMARRADPRSQTPPPSAQPPRSPASQPLPPPRIRLSAHHLPRKCSAVRGTVAW